MFPEQPAWADELTTGVTNVLVWYPIDERFFYANAIATGFAAAAVPVFYLVRWPACTANMDANFARSRSLREATRHKLSISCRSAGPMGMPRSRRVQCEGVGADMTWYAVLGLSSSASDRRGQRGL